MGGIIMTALQILEEETALAGSSLVNQVAEIEKTPEAFALILDGHDQLIAFADSLVRRVMCETGASDPKRQKGAYYATLNRWGRAERKLRNKVRRHRPAFEETRAESEGETKVSPVKNAGGKPLAKHWDAMWAEIATQLWSGDLQPETQADIKIAMFGWLNAQGIEAGDTVVTERARALWLRMERER